MSSDKKRRVAIRTENRYLYQKLYLELCEDFEIVEDRLCDIELCDIDTASKNPGSVTLSYRHGSGADIILPVRLGEISARLSERKESPLALEKESRSVILKGERIRLTEIEYALFSLLYSKADFVSRAEILDTVWGNEADGGIINVYVHYLRDKLEKSGEKLIISSRKMGYRISEKYCTEGENGI